MPSNGKVARIPAWLSKEIAKPPVTSQEVIDRINHVMVAVADGEVTSGAAKLLMDSLRVQARLVKQQAGTGGSLVGLTDEEKAALSKDPFDG